MESGIVSLLLILVSTSASENLVFVAVGDWGGKPTDPYATQTEQYVARAMGDTAASMKSQFTIALGDNFYFEGVTNVADPRFNETFEVS